MGIVPQLPPREIVSTWTPVLKEVGHRAGQCLVLVIAPSIPAFEQQLRTGKLDFAFLNPYHQVMAQRWRGFIPLVRDGQTPLEGILVVRKDSPLRRLSDLNGATVAFPAPNAFAASLLPRALLARDGIRISPSYVRTHSNVYRAVILGSSRAGGGVNNTLQRERPIPFRRQPAFRPACASRCRQVSWSWGAPPTAGSCLPRCSCRRW